MCDGVCVVGMCVMGCVWWGVWWGCVGWDVWCEMAIGFGGRCVLRG